MSEADLRVEKAGEVGTVAGRHGDHQRRDAQVAGVDQLLLERLQHAIGRATVVAFR